MQRKKKEILHNLPFSRQNWGNEVRSGSQDQYDLYRWIWRNYSEARLNDLARGWEATAWEPQHWHFYINFTLSLSGILSANEIAAFFVTSVSWQNRHGIFSKGQDFRYKQDSSIKNKDCSLLFLFSLPCICHSCSDHCPCDYKNCWKTYRNEDEEIKGKSWRLSLRNKGVILHPFLLKKHLENAGTRMKDESTQVEFVNKNKTFKVQ